MKKTVFLICFIFVANAFAGIVATADNANKFTKKAEADLTSFLTMISGEKWTAVPEKNLKKSGEKVIYLGDTAFARSKNIKTSDFADEEWFVRSFPEGMVITGGEPIGAFYGACDLLNKIGVQGEVYKSGKMKDMLSPTRERTPEEQRIVQELVQECYVKFAGIVSKSRKIPLSKITGGPIGDGRVYHGTKALAYGMVDKLGYLEDAVALCEELSKSGRNSLTVKTYKKDFDFMEKFLEEKIFLKDGINLKLNLPGNAPAVELKPGRLYYLPAGL